MKRTRTVIQWRVKSKAEFLPAGDIRWSEFCTVEEGGKHNSASIIVLDALNLHSPTTVEMEFRKLARKGS